MPRAYTIILGIIVAAHVALAAPAASAQDYQSATWGGHGGGGFTLRCADGDYLVGLSARSGDWVDAIAPLCGAWDVRQQAFLPPGLGPMQGGAGGNASEHVCDRSSALTAIQVEIVPSGHRNVAFLLPHCTSVISLQGSNNGQFGYFGTTYAERDARAQGVGVSSYTMRPGLGERLQCHDGDFAVGIYGGAGLYVDRIGLICAPRPLVTSPATRRSAPVANSVPRPISPDAAAGASVRVTPERPLSPDAAAGANVRVTSERQRPRECIEGYAWRMARIPDFVCVTTQSHYDAQAENAAAASRVDPNGAWGPSTCIAGYVWREAWDGDVVCVTPPRRDVVRAENSVAANFQVP